MRRSEMVASSEMPMASMSAACTMEGGKQKSKSVVEGGCVSLCVSLGVSPYLGRVLAVEVAS